MSSSQRRKSMSSPLRSTACINDSSITERIDVKSPSPLKLWSPSRPVKEGTRSNVQDSNELAPMDLLAHSFESSATPLRNTFDRESPMHPGSVEMNFTDLKQEGCDYSIGDISPIKFVYSNVSHQDTHSEETLPPPTLPRVQLHHGQPNPVYVIRSFAKVFRKFKYTLPCLHGIGLPTVNLTAFSPVRQIHLTNTSVVDLDMKVALRRAEAAVCAFGGTVQDYRSHAQSIFRLRDRVAADTRDAYERTLAGRYYLSGSRLSWEFEENPPITIDEEEDLRQRHESDTSHLTNSPSGHNSSTEQSSLGSANSGDSKLKYRCKLCGQIKNNHDCPYRQPLQRSIGVMVYPAVNSFTAFEPGTVAPPLTKMNNFVSYDSDYSATAHAYTPEDPQDHHHLMESFMSNETHQQHPSPESPFHSPQSSLSSHDEHHNATRHTTPSRHATSNNSRKRAREPQSLETRATRSTKATTPEEADRKSVFVTAVTLRPEHYRAVTPSDSPTAWQYPPVPLTFSERKRLSDTLFHFSKEIPHLTAECAAVLRLAREHDDWDLAVAELLTQVLVGLFCNVEDTRLEGLSEYLLALGISC
eukprot:scaffold3600_cov171-Amphora_coffeaeformis.AAC.14